MRSRRRYDLCAPAAPLLPSCSERSQAPPPGLGLLFLPAGTNESARRLPTTVIYKSEARQQIRSHVQLRRGRGGSPRGCGVEVRQYRSLKLPVWNPPPPTVILDGLFTPTSPPGQMPPEAGLHLGLKQMTFSFQFQIPNWNCRRTFVGSAFANWSLLIAERD